MVAGAAPYYASGHTTMSTKVLTPLLNRRKSQDLIYRASPTWEITNQFGMKVREEFGEDFLISLLMDRAEGIDSFAYYQPVSVTASPGAKAARFELAWYSAPMSMSLHEEAVYTSDKARASRIVEYLDQVEAGYTERLALDEYRGNVSKSTNILGLEQVFPPYKHLESDGSAAANAITDRLIYEAQTRQAANTYGGISRTAWGLDTSGNQTEGTGWEGHSFDFSCDGNNATGFGLSSGEYNETFKRFAELVSAATYGIYSPNVFIASSLPFNDYDFMGFGKTQIRKTPGKFENLNLGYDTLMFRDGIFIKDDNCRTHNTGLGDGAAPLNSENIYGFAIDDVKCVVDSRFDFAPTDPRTPYNVHAGTTFIIWRGQRVFCNPRFGFRGFKYGTT